MRTKKHLKKNALESGFLMSQALRDSTFFVWPKLLSNNWDKCIEHLPINTTSCVRHQIGPYIECSMSVTDMTNKQLPRDMKCHAK